MRGSSEVAAKESSLGDVGLVRKLEDAVVKGVDDDGSTVVLASVVAAANAEKVAEAIWTDCSIVERQILHWYDDVGQPGSTRSEIPTLR